MSLWTSHVGITELVLPVPPSERHHLLALEDLRSSKMMALDGRHGVQGHGAFAAPLLKVKPIATTSGCELPSCLAQQGLEPDPNSAVQHEENIINRAADSNRLEHIPISQVAWLLGWFNVGRLTIPSGSP